MKKKFKIIVIVLLVVLVTCVVVKQFLFTNHQEELAKTTAIKLVDTQLILEDIFNTYKKQDTQSHLVDITDFGKMLVLPQFDELIAQPESFLFKTNTGKKRLLIAVARYNKDEYDGKISVEAGHPSTPSLDLYLIKWLNSGQYKIISKTQKDKGYTCGGFGLSSFSFEHKPVIESFGPSVQGSIQECGYTSMGYTTTSIIPVILFEDKPIVVSDAVDFYADNGGTGDSIMRSTDSTYQFDKENVHNGLYDLVVNSVGTNETFTTKSTRYQFNGTNYTEVKP